jgi:TPR repeat protein
MPAGLRCGLLTVCTAFIMALPANADNVNFADLLARAEAQAAAGHRWAPPDDNMIETVMRMMDILPTATPAQLAELAALLETDKPSPPAVRNAAPSTDPGLAEAELPRTPTASLESPPIAAVPLSSPPAVPPASPPAVPPSLPPVMREPPAPTAAGEVLPEAGARAGVLFARGLEAELRGDFSAARRYFASAAQQGSAAAARNLGRLYDPAYLRQTALGGIDPNPVLAREWYQRAVRLGDPEAVPLLEALSVR